MRTNPTKALFLLLISVFLLTGWRSITPSSHPNTAPEPSYLSAVGIGVSDLEQSVAFYQSGLGMTEVKRQVRADRIEVVMESADARGSQVMLIQFTDNKDRVYNQNPGKIVFYARDVNQFAANIAQSGGQIILPPTPQPQFGGALVGFGRDPDQNLIEMVGNPEAEVSFMSAFGIGVSDLEAARDFYVGVIGLRQQAYLEIPGQYNEYILESSVPGSSALVLMHWTNDSERNYQDNPLKLEFASGTAIDLARRIKKAGYSLLQYPRPEKNLNNTLVGYGKDADGNLLELQRARKSYLASAAIGVADLDASIAFYKDGLGMHQVAIRLRNNREEVVMESADGRGSYIVLMGFTDGKPRDYANNPGKLVFYVKDTSEFVYSIIAAGGELLLPPTPQPELGGVEVGFARDINNNLIEIVGVPTAKHSYFAAFGIGVSDLEAAKSFYTDTLGFKVSQFLSTTSYDEYILESTQGSALVLMHWTNGSERNYQNNPVKLELRTLSPLGTAANIKQSGNKVLGRPRLSHDAGLEGEITGYAKDADGTLLELFKAQWDETE